MDDGKTICIYGNLKIDDDDDWWSIYAPCFD